MKMLIRADSNNYIGTGHIMRCMAIAKTAEKLGHNIKFVVADTDSELILCKYGMAYTCMNTVWNKLDEELDAFTKIIYDESPDCIIIDSYYVTSYYLKKLKEQCKVAYIDDLNTFKYPCDLLICYANYYKKFNYEKIYKNNETYLLLGPRYAPLREEFSGIKVEKKKIEKKSILIMSGGTDEHHIVKRILEEMDKTRSLKKHKVIAICGIYNKDYDELMKKYIDNENITLLKAVDNMEQYMTEADIAVSAGGTTLYELCACGTPTICYSFVDNQLDNVKSFSEDGIMTYIGDIRTANVVENIVDEIEMLVCDETARNTISQRMRKLVDGKGTERIIREICNYLEGEERK